MKNRIIKNPLVFVYPVANPIKVVQEHLQHNDQLDKNKKSVLNAYLNFFVKQNNIVFDKKYAKNTTKGRHCSIKQSKFKSLQSGIKQTQQGRNNFTPQKTQRSQIKRNATASVGPRQKETDLATNNLWNKIKQSPLSSSFSKWQKRNNINKVRQSILYDRCLQYNKFSRTLKQIDSRRSSKNQSEMKTNQDFQIEIQNAQNGFCPQRSKNTQTPQLEQRIRNYDKYKTIQAGYYTSQDNYKNNLTKKQANHSIPIKNSHKNNKNGRYSFNQKITNAQNQQSISICLWQPCKISSIALEKRPQTKQMSKFINKINTMVMEEGTLKLNSPVNKSRQKAYSRKRHNRAISQTIDSIQIIQPWKHSIQLLQN